jgi:hypothetical protein
MVKIKMRKTLLAQILFQTIYNETLKTREKSYKIGEVRPDMIELEMTTLESWGSTYSSRKDGRNRLRPGFGM